MVANMTGYDWLMVFGAVVLFGFVARGFWKADKTEAIEQPDSKIGPDGTGWH